ncbi:cupredoxin domain-containing protein [Sutcliffiella halmapala]|uniref:hypothetical protein n=1 Tax=Sutcliffiella halmapala TaxID=79882 RepID=UPI0011174B75|nr:hypothetical protein [Sutcliffiella halmapala]
MMKHIFSILLLSLILIISGCGNTALPEKKVILEADREITIVGHTGPELEDFYFEPAEIIVKKGEIVKLTLESSNAVEHGIQVPALKITLTDKSPEIFSADKVGEFEGRCSILCGAGHAVMSFKVIVEE